MTDAPKSRAAYLAEAERARKLAERTPNPRVKVQWLRVEASYRAMAEGSLSPRDLGIIVPQYRRRRRRDG